MRSSDLANIAADIYIRSKMMDGSRLARWVNGTRSILSPAQSQRLEKVLESELSENHPAVRALRRGQEKQPRLQEIHQTLVVTIERALSVNGAFRQDLTGILGERQIDVREPEPDRPPDRGSAGRARQFTRWHSVGSGRR